MTATRKAEGDSNPRAAFELRDAFMADYDRTAARWIEAGLPKICSVAFYCATDGEMDPLPLAVSLAEKGHRLCLPWIEIEDDSMPFRSFAIGDELARGAYGISQPAVVSPVVEPDVLLVPLLAFDGQLNRLGRGGGYYDRALSEIRKKRKAIAIGIAFAAQKVPCVPIQPHDQKLDAVATEKGVLYQRPYEI